MNTKTVDIILLPDGETWSVVEGCTILTINLEQYDDLSNDNVSANDITPIKWRPL